MEEMRIEIRSDQVELAAKKLIISLMEDLNVTVGNNSDLWMIFEQLSLEGFTSLKKNVYFADFLRSLCISIGPEKDCFVETTGSDVSAHNVNANLMSESEKLLMNIEEVGKKSLSLDRIKMPPLSTKLDDLQLPGRFLKLVNRLRRASLYHANFSFGDTLGDLVNLSTDDITPLPGVGGSYVEIFKELKLLSLTAPVYEPIEALVVEKKVELSSVDISNMRLSLVGVDSKFTKALEKYERYIGVGDLAEHLDKILEFDRNSLFALPGFGGAIVDRLIELRELIRKEVESIAVGEICYEQLDSTLIVPKFINQLPMGKVENILLEDIDAYLDKISESEAGIAQRRWGFVENKQTLEDVAVLFNLTRERIRQKEVKINKGLLRNLRINQDSLWQLIESELSPDLTLKFKNLSSCFSSEKDFYEFLGLVCGREGLVDYVYPHLEKSILNTYFAENGAPIHIDEAREYIVGLNLNEVKSVNNAIKYLAHQGALFIEGDHIWPKQLRKAEASACVLVNHEKGLPWADIAKLVNSNGYSKTEIYEDRLDHEAFKLPDYIYLAGKGIYKHTSFINVDPVSLDEIFIEIMDYAESNGRDVFHLNECYHASKYLRRYDYFVVRHFVKHFGEDYGFYFHGQSQADSVGLSKGFKNITQKDVIIEAMSRCDKPLTKPEIASLLKSKSLGHAAFYLDELIDTGRVVQVDRMLYTTPELAYKNIKISDYINAIDNTLMKYGKPVESSILKEDLNPFFDKDYTKYFYASIARLYAKKQGWHRKNSLYSVSEIPFKTLKSVLDVVCGVEFSVDQNVSALQKHIAITREAAVTAITNWRNAPMNR